MTEQDFDTILNERIESIKSVLKRKASEYAMSSDRLHNFKVAALIKDETPELALWGMAIKHLVSVIDLIDSVECHRTACYSAERVNEKIGDLINYLILLEALLKERLADI